MTTVRVGERGVDFSFARPPAARLLELGFTFIVGYISVPPSAPAKNISKAQCEDYLAAGLKVLLVWEMSASRPNLGAAYGTMDGTNAKRLAKDLGYPQDIPILFACDTNTVATNVVAQEAYMRAAAIAAAPYPAGIYGDTDILDACMGLWRIGWLPNAWAWSGGSRAQAEARAKALGAHVLQRKGFYIDDVWAVDPNDVIADFQAWGLAPDFPPPNPQPEDDTLDIRLLTFADSDAQFLAEATVAGRVLNCRWVGTAKLSAARDVHKAAAAADHRPFEYPFEIPWLANVALFGPLPVGDSKHTWNGSEFAAIDGGGTIDLEARELATNAYDRADNAMAEALHASEALTRIGSTISDIRMGGQRIADAGGH